MRRCSRSKSPFWAATGPPEACRDRECTPHGSRDSLYTYKETRMAGKRILALSVSAGHGHVRAADALVAGTARWFPENEARQVDLMSLTPTLFRKAYKDSYLKLVQSHPALWGYIYSRTDLARADSALARLRKAIESACNKKLLEIIQDYAPDHIICTHFMPLQVLARWKGKGRLATPVWTCVTDFVAHRFWLEPGQQGYFTADEENVWRMRQRGLESENIRATGIPVMPEFTPPADAAKARREAAELFGLDPQKTTFLLMGGGAGVGNMQELTTDLLALPEDFQLVALAGKNQRLLEDLRAQADSHAGRLFPLGFTSEVHLLLAAADLVITKPGGLTTVECLAMGKPMLVCSPIPGQEEQNADFLLENGAALKAADKSGLLWRVTRLLREPQTLERMGKNAAALGRPYAARDILAEVLGEMPRKG